MATSRPAAANIRSPTMYTVAELTSMSAIELKVQLDAFKAMQEQVVLPLEEFTDETINKKASEMTVRGNMRTILVHISHGLVCLEKSVANAAQCYFMERFEATDLTEAQKTAFRLRIQLYISFLDRKGLEFYDWPAKANMFQYAPISKVAKDKGYTLPIPEIDRLRIANMEAEFKKEIERFNTTLNNHKADLKAGRIGVYSFASVAIALIDVETRTPETVSSTPSELTIQEENLMRYLWDPRVPRLVVAT